LKIKQYGKPPTLKDPKTQTHNFNMKQKTIGEADGENSGKEEWKHRALIGIKKEHYRDI